MELQIEADAGMWQSLGKTHMLCKMSLAYKNMAILQNPIHHLGTQKYSVNDLNI